MSTPNPTHIIAEHQLRDWYPMTGRPVSKSWLCSCGFKDGLQMPCSTADVKRAHAEHVVSKLTDAGYSIVSIPELDDLDCVSAAPGSEKVRCYLDDARMTAEDARDLAGQLLAAADAAEGDTNGR